jgi:stress response protein YsnF
METLNRDQLVAAHGTDVIDANGDKIGAIEDIYYDDTTGQAEWVGIGVGIFGLKRRVVPVQGARFDGDALRVSYDKDMVKDSPDVDGDEISSERERDLYAYYGLAGSMTGTGTAMDAGTGLDYDRTSGTDAREGEMVRSEEELRVGTRETEAGRVRLRKWVETEPVEETVEVRRETAHVTREPIDRPAAAGALGEQEVEMTLHEERPVVEKETVARERVGLERDVEVDHETVRDEVRKERIDIDDDSRR